MEYRISVGGIEWLYTEKQGGSGDLVVIGHTPDLRFSYKEYGLPKLARQVNDEITTRAILSFSPKASRYVGDYEFVTVDQVRDALKDFPELFTQEMRLEYNFIRFVERSCGTQWICYDRRDDYAIGELKYYVPWRQWCYFPVRNSLYSSGCMADIQDFIRQLENSASEKQPKEKA